MLSRYPIELARGEGSARGCRGCAIFGTTDPVVARDSAGRLGLAGEILGGRDAEAVEGSTH